MNAFSHIFNVLGELVQLAGTLLGDGVRFTVLCARSRTAVAAENLFLRKQLAFYQERNVVPRRFDNVSRFMLALLSRAFAWKGSVQDTCRKLSQAL